MMGRRREQTTVSLEEIVKGKEGESGVMKTHPQHKMTLNDEIRLKMQERLKIMKESDSEDNGVNEMD